ncbi:transient receptor potential cation channel protein painless-like [Planococcus citri]|uniref:transient receptor potential cation channel protein painless-like n=1 Tax=Planococcus citri TaxID=170843 RepID=UPI0031F76F64
MTEEDIPLLNLNPNDSATIDETPTKLLSFLEEKDIGKFTLLLDYADENFDVNHFYGEPHNGTLLDIACRSKDNHEFVKILIQHDAKINNVNRISGKAPIHEVVENSDLDTLNVLMKNITCDVNLIDQSNMTPVMRAAFAGRVDMLLALMKNEKVSFQPVNNKLILHSLVDGWDRCSSSGVPVEKADEFFKGLKMILDCFPRNGFQLVASTSQPIQERPSFSLSSSSDKKDQEETICLPRVVHETRKEPEPPKSTSTGESSPTPSSRHSSASISPQQQSSTSIYSYQQNNHNDDPSDPSSDQMQLLSSFKQNNFNKFVDILANGTCSNSTDVNYYYSDPENGTLLDLICRTQGNSEFAKKLIMNGAWINFQNHKNHGKTPLHTAIEYSDETTLKILQTDATCDVNTTDNRGNTALHVAALRNNIPAVKLLLQHPAMDINQRNSTNDAALNIALNRDHKEVIREILKRREVDLVFGKDLRGRSCGELIREKYTKMNVASFGEMDDRNKELFTLLYKGDTESFINLVGSRSYELYNDDNDGFYTYLQYACNRGFVDVVDRLLAMETLDPNYCCPNNIQTPIMIAAGRGYYTVVSSLLKDSRVSLKEVHQEGSILHSLFRGKLAMEDTNELNDKACDHYKCLEFILNKSSHRELNLNCTDRDGNTALYYAVKLNDKRSILLLLEAGSYICHKNHTGETILKSIHHELLKEYLDSCVLTNGVSSKQTDHQIELNVQIFRPPDDQLQVPEIEPLLVLNAMPQSRYLLKHPVLTSFLNLKWHRNRLFYYINLICYIVFWITLNCFIFYWNMAHNFSLSSSSGPTAPPSPSPSSPAPSSSPDSKDPGKIIEDVIQILIASMGLLLILRELFQLYASPRKYLASFENWLEICLLITTALFLSCPFDNKLKSQLAAVIIITSWMELILLIGRHPALSTSSEIFKTVTVNFLKLLRYYGILIIAFAFCFHILKPNNAKSGMNLSTNQTNITTISNIGKMSFNLFLMITSIDYETKSVFLGDNLFNINYFLFAICFFLITIVLYNLLNGLAVTDISNIKQNAELLVIVSRMRVIWYIESTLSTLDPNPIICLAKRFAYYSSCCFCCSCRDQQQPQNIQKPTKKYIKLFRNRTHLFPNTLPDSKICILPNDKNSILLAVAGNSNDDSHKSQSYPILRHSSWIIDSDIVEQAKEILQKQNKQMHFNYAELITKPYTKQATEIEQNLVQIEQKLEQKVVKLGSDIKPLLKRIEHKLDKEEVEIEQKLEWNLKQVVQKLDELETKCEKEIDFVLEKPELISKEQVIQQKESENEVIPSNESDSLQKESDQQGTPHEELDKQVIPQKESDKQIIPWKELLGKEVIPSKSEANIPQKEDSSSQPKSSENQPLIPLQSEVEKLAGKVPKPLTGEKPTKSYF